MQSISQSNLLSVWHISRDRTSGSHRKEAGSSVNLDRAMLQVVRTASNEEVGGKKKKKSATANVSQNHLKYSKAFRIGDPVLQSFAIPLKVS